MDYSRVPYSTLECYQLLVTRYPKTEDWSLVAGVEAESRALFVEASTSDPCMPCRTRNRLLTVRATGGADW